MAIIDKVMVEVLNIVERNLGGTQSFVPTPTQTPAIAQTSTSPSASPTSTGGGNSQSPLLFFVALGFGVVFTNLWIIVGVKYCFRYNARNRALARGEDGEPINLEAMPRPHRRRREKKLMTMDEVNERFPMMKYKNWVAARASEGLPTAGGVASVPSSRAASLRDAEGVIPSSPVTSKHSDDRPMTGVSTTGTPEVTVSSVTSALGGSVPADGRKSTEGRKSVDAGEKKTEAKDAMPTLTEVDTVATHERKSEDDDDDDVHIHDALPPEMVANPGDSCAICIDTLEPDDDVRGLTCGHAFHAGCLDPWLTGRRACCPLCKADYFIPKPRPEGEEAAAPVERPRRGTMGRMNMPNQPRSAWIGVRGSRGMVLPGRFMSGSMHESPNNTNRSRRERHLRTPENNTLEPLETNASGTTGDATTDARRPFTSRIGNPFSSMHMPAMRLPGRRRQEPAPQTVVEEPTPAQLEAGVVR